MCRGCQEDQNKSFEHSEGRYSIFLEDPMQAPKMEFSEGRGSCIGDQQEVGGKPCPWICYCNK